MCIRDRVCAKHKSCVWKMLFFTLTSIPDYLFIPSCQNATALAAATFSESTPVSYTHLDVYKRQEQHDIRWTADESGIYQTAVKTSGYHAARWADQPSGSSDNREMCIRDSLNRRVEFVVKLLFMESLLTGWKMLWENGGKEIFLFHDFSIHYPCG